MTKRVVRRKKLIENDEKPAAKEKFLEVAREENLYAQKQSIPKFEAATNNQKKALAMFRDGRSVIFLTGAAGTGKSILAAFHAATQLRQKLVNKLYLVRPAVAVGKSIGLLPGEIADKMAPYFAQTINHLEKFMGHGYMQYCLEKGIIEMKPAEYMRGMSFENCVVVCEESQNFTREDFEMTLTRLGKGCTLILTGDTKQHDLKGESGLSQTITLIKKTQSEQPAYMNDEDLEQMDSNIGIVEFTMDDVVRSGITKSFVKMYHHN